MAIKIYTMSNNPNTITINSEFWTKFFNERIVKDQHNQYRIHKSDMKKSIKEALPEGTYLNDFTMISALKNKGLTYNRAVRCGGKRGCFIGYCIKPKSSISKLELIDKLQSKINELIDLLKSEI